MKKCAVIILNWNGREMLEKFLPSVVASTCSQETDVWVADNGSTDDSLTWLALNAPEVKVLKLDKNYGYAEGYNKAIAQLNYEYSLLLNSDVETPQGWWQPLLDFMAEHPDAAAVQPKIRAYRNKEYFEHAGAAGGLIDSLGFPYCYGRVLDKVEKDNGQYDHPEGVEVAWASGAALMVRTHIFRRVGGFDESFFAHMEEIDLCWRMQLAGYKIYCVTDSVVYHLGGGALPYGNPRKTYLNFRNNLLMLRKNLPDKYGRKFLVKRRLVDTAAFLLFLLKGKWGDARAVIKAHADYRKMQRDYTYFPEDNLLHILPGSGRSIITPF